MKLLVVGGGPAGMTAALQARELQAEVTLLESKRVGGTNLNEGPAPVRTLARAARLARDAASWETFGLQGARPHIDLAAVLANANRVAHYASREKAPGRVYTQYRCRARRRSWSCTFSRSAYGGVWPADEAGRQTRSSSLRVDMGASCPYLEPNWP